MYAQVEKPKENISRAVGNSVAQKKSNRKLCFGFVDNRAATIAQRKIYQRITNSELSKIYSNNESEEQPNSDNVNTYSSEPLIGSSPIQLLKNDAIAYINSISVGKGHFNNPSSPTQAEIINFAKDSSLDASVRMGLVKAWNMGQSVRWSISESIIGGSSILKAPMSPTATSYDGDTSSFTGLRSAVVPKLSLYTASTGSTAPIPQVTGFPQCARMVRAHDVEKPTLASAQDRSFFVQQGGYTGLMESPRGNDHVFTNTTPSASGGYQRTGGIRPWTTLLSELNSNFGGSFKTTMLEILGVVRGTAQANSPLIFEVAGALSCDAKKSIQGYMLYLKEIEDGINNGTLTSFSAVFGKGGVYEPAMVGGRKAPANKRDNASASDLSGL